MQLLAGIQRPTNIHRAPVVKERKEKDALLDTERLVLKTIKLALVLRGRDEFTMFNNLCQSNNAGLPTALFMLIRANKLSVTGAVVEEALSVLRMLRVLDIGGLGKLVSGEWPLGVVLVEMEKARLLKGLTEWRMARRGKVVRKPLEAYLALVIKRGQLKKPSDLLFPEDQGKEIYLEQRYHQTRLYLDLISIKINMM